MHGVNVAEVKQALREVGHDAHQHIGNALRFQKRRGQELEVNEIAVLATKAKSRRQVLHRDTVDSEEEKRLARGVGASPMSLSFLISLQEGFWFHFVRGSHRLDDEELAGRAEERIWVAEGQMLVFSQLLVHGGGAAEKEAVSTRLRLHGYLDNRTLVLARPPNTTFPVQVNQ